MLVFPEAWRLRLKGQDIFDWLFAVEGKVYKEKEGRRTLRFTLFGKDYFAKVHRGVGWKEITKNLCQFRLPVLGAQNEWRAIQHLQQLGVETAPLVAYGKRGWNPARLQSFVITEALDNTVSLENFCREWPTSPPSYLVKRALITKVATIARTLHEHGMNHRDFYICHFLMDISQGLGRVDPHRLKLFLIDLHRMQIRRRIPWRWRVKDIASLYFSSMDIGLTQRDLLRFVWVYGDKPLKESLTKDKAFWWQVRKRGDRLYGEFIRKNRTMRPPKLMASSHKSTCPICHGHGKPSFQSRDLLYDKPKTYEYMQCSRCGLIYQHPMPNPVEISSFYLDDYVAYEPLGRLKRRGPARLAVLRHRYGYSHLDVPWLFQLLAPMLSVFRHRDAIPFVPSGKALDIGCGNGKFMRAMNALGWQFEGVEFNSTAVNICRREGLKVFQGDLHEAAFEDNAFDLVSARHVIEHMRAPGHFVAEIVRILKKGGRLVIRTPNSQALGRQWFGKYWYANEVPRHLVLFSPRNLRMLTERHGLRLITEKLFTSPKIVLNSWDYLTGNRDKPSRKRKILRSLTRPYMMLATVSGRGDEVFAIYEKP